MQQVRWFCDVWQAAQSQRSKGVDLVAVTSWALLGAYDWDSLLTEHNDNYERGAFELINGRPEPTELAVRLRKLATDENSIAENGPLSEVGWWNQPARIRYPTIELDVGSPVGHSI
jgi:dTDP-4-dehydrorhamnose reductase